jgi:hypothetical protein
LNPDFVTNELDMNKANMYPAVILPADRHQQKVFSFSINYHLIVEAIAIGSNIGMTL